MSSPYEALIGNSREFADFWAAMPGAAVSHPSVEHGIPRCRAVMTAGRKCRRGNLVAGVEGDVVSRFPLVRPASQWLSGGERQPCIVLHYVT